MNVRYLFVVVMMLAALAACAGPQAASTPPSTEGEADQPSAATTAGADKAVETTLTAETVSPLESPAEPDSTAATDQSVGEWDCGDQSRLGAELHIFSWADYIPADEDNNLLAEFEEACGVRVTLDTYPSNEDLAAKIRAGNSGYDLIVPSDYMVAILAEEGRLLKLDKAALPNIKNIDPAQMSLYYDPNDDYSVPYQYGMTGIAYDASQVDPPPSSWSAVFDPDQLAAYENQVSMLDDERESIGAALRYLGFSVNSTDAGELEHAKDLLLQQKAMLAAYDSENVSSTLSSGEVLVAHAWNGAASLAKSENPNIEWIVPEEGGVIWQDCLAIPADVAPEPYTAHVFINILLNAGIGARITDYTYYLTPNTAARELLSEEVTAIQFYPDDEMRERLEWIERKGDAAMYADIWTEVKGQ